MKPPDEIKKGLNICGELDGDCDNCAYAGFKVFRMDRLRQDALTYIQQLEAKDAKQSQYIAKLEASYSQVSKALCGKENATLDELLQVIDQVKQNKPGKKLVCEITIGGEDIRKALEKVELDGKTLAEWAELVKGYKQLEAELESVRRERDAAVADLGPDCCTCKHKGETERCRWSPCGYEWRGVCPDTEVQEYA